MKGEANHLSFPPLDDLPTISFYLIAAGLGIGPRLGASKAPVLPLDDPAMRLLCHNLPQLPPDIRSYTLP